MLESSGPAWATMRVLPHALPPRLRSRNMIRELIRLGLCAAAASMLLTLSPGVLLAAESRAIDFKDEVQPILRRHCDRCHGETTKKRA